MKSYIIALTVYIILSSVYVISVQLDARNIAVCMQKVDTVQCLDNM